MINFKKISDEELFNRCKKFGKDVLKARQIFGGLLPEVCKRRLYEKKGFDSIYEFAAKLAGLTHEQVDTYIRLERKYEDKPLLRRALVEGQISVNKLVRIASIATVENQSELFEVAQKLSKAAIDVYVKDYKLGRAGGRCRAGRAGESGRPGRAGESVRPVDENEKQSGLFTPENATKTLPVQTSKEAANIDFEIIAALSPDLKIKIKTLLDKGINISEIFTEFLEQREQSIEQKKEEIAEDLERKSAQKSLILESGRPSATLQIKPVTRYIPATLKKIIAMEYGIKCGNSNCIKLAENLHHQKRFAIFKTHNPRFIRPLCKGHHELEHADDQKYRKFRLAATG